MGCNPSDGDLGTNAVGWPCESGIQVRDVVEKPRSRNWSWARPTLLGCVVWFSETDRQWELMPRSAEALRLRQHVGVELGDLPSYCRANLVRS